MPIVHIRITREGVTTQHKSQLIRGATDLLLNVLGKPPSTTMVVVDEVELENWGIGGLPVEEFRRQVSVVKETTERGTNDSRQAN